MSGSGAIPLGRSSSLATLKDVAGITGSFAFCRSGALVARDMPAMFDDGTLTEAGERLTRVGETLANVGDELELAVVRFQDHKLYVKVLSAGMLCVLADPQVNVAALRMAVNLVGRRIAPALEEAEQAALALAADGPTRTEDTVRTEIPTAPPEPSNVVPSNVVSASAEPSNVMAPHVMFSNWASPNATPANVASSNAASSNATPPNAASPARAIPGATARPTNPATQSVRRFRGRTVG